MGHILDQGCGQGNRLGVVFCGFAVGQLHIVFKTDKTLSRIHLVVTAEEGEFFIEDRSANGTFVNGAKIEKGVKALVQINDEIRIGREGTLVELSDPKISRLICD